MITVTGIITFCGNERAYRSSGREMRCREYIIRDVAGTEYSFYALNEDISRYHLAECMNTTVVLWLYSRVKDGVWRTYLRLMGTVRYGLSASLTTTDEQRRVEITDNTNNKPVMAEVSYKKH